MKKTVVVPMSAIISLVCVFGALGLTVVVILGYNVHLSHQLEARDVDNVLRSVNGMLIVPEPSVDLRMNDSDSVAGKFKVYRNYYGVGQEMLCGSLEWSRSAATGFEVRYMAEPQVQYFTDQSGKHVGIVKFLSVGQARRHHQVPPVIRVRPTFNHPASFFFRSGPVALQLVSRPVGLRLSSGLQDGNRIQRNPIGLFPRQVLHEFDRC
jgi:hypothetical protein